MSRLNARHLAGLRREHRPGYDPAAHGIGIVHLGLGAFHRAHQAAYTDAAIAGQGGDWRIAAVSLRSVGTVDAMAAQDGLYTLLERDANADRIRVIAAIGTVIAAARDRPAVIERLASPQTRIVSLTVTEKAYGFDRTAMDIDPSHPAIAADLDSPRRPCGVIGLLVEALRQARAARRRPPTILCCDNLPENGRLLRAGVVGFARRIDSGLADWIAGEVAFPCSMVDRITPAPTRRTLARVQSLIGVEDRAAIETEAFSQWVIEDDFPSGRPAWDAAGALFVEDVTAFERMKLRMLNGTHSLIAYAGFLAGHAHVREVMADGACARLADRHLRAAARTVGALPGIDLDAYRRALAARFANPAIAHETYQIAMDGTEKLPQRLLAPAVEAIEAGDDLSSYAFAVAAWMRYAIGRDDRGRSYALRDPRADELTAKVHSAGADARALTGALMALTNLFPDRLRDHSGFVRAVETRLESMLELGMAAAIAEETS